MSFEITAMIERDKWLRAMIKVKCFRHHGNSLMIKAFDFYTRGWGFDSPSKHGWNVIMCKNMYLVWFIHISEKNKPFCFSYYIFLWTKVIIEIQSCEQKLLKSIVT